MFDCYIVYPLYPQKLYFKYLLYLRVLSNRNQIISSDLDRVLY